MKEKILRLACAVLLVCVILPITVSCGNVNNESGESNGAQSDDVSNTLDSTDDSTFETDESGFVKDTIDRKLTDTEITILMDSSSVIDIMPDRKQIENNIIAENSYKRKLTLEQKLGCKFTVIEAKGEWSGMNDYIVAAEKAGYDSVGVDILCSFSLVPSQLVSKGMLANLNKLEYPQLEMPWWPKSIENWQHSGALYFVANNSSNRVIRAQEVVFANNQIIIDNGLETLEQKVINGEWTIELMNTYAKNVNTDVTADKPIYGLAVDDQSRMDQFLYGADIKMTTLSNNGNVELALISPSNIDKVDKLIEKLGEIANTQGFYIDSNDSLKLIQNKRAMFVAGYMNMLIITDPKNESGYIPLPTPKYDNTDQENYVTTPHNSYDMWSIPKFCENKEDAALVIEAIASTDYRTLAPQFYDNMLKARYSIGADGAKIFDIIRNATNLDFGRVTAASVDILETHFRTCFYRAGGTTYINNYISRMNIEEQSRYKSKLDTLLFEFDLYKEQ